MPVVISTEKVSTGRYNGMADSLNSISLAEPGVKFTELFAFTFCGTTKLIVPMFPLPDVFLWSMRVTAKNILPFAYSGCIKLSISEPGVPNQDELKFIFNVFVST